MNPQTNPTPQVSPEVREAISALVVKARTSDRCSAFSYSHNHIVDSICAALAPFLTPKLADVEAERDAAHKTISAMLDALGYNNNPRDPVFAISAAGDVIEERDSFKSRLTALTSALTVAKGERYKKHKDTLHALSKIHPKEVGQAWDEAGIDAALTRISAHLAKPDGDGAPKGGYAWENMTDKSEAKANGDGASAGTEEETTL